MHAGTRCPRTVDACSLLGPFDSLIWHRDRAESLFGARIKLEVYTPKPKRKYGYYVLPFLFGDRIVARVDLKVDRDAKVLHVLSTHGESGIPAGTYISALADELRLMARWLALQHIEARRVGDTAEALRQALTS